MGDDDHPGNRHTADRLLDRAGQPGGQSDDSGKESGTDETGENPMTNAPEGVAPTGGSAAAESPADSGASGGPTCCDSPALRDVAPGTRYKLDGSVFASEEGDKECENCGAVIDSKGELFR